MPAFRPDVAMPRFLHTADWQIGRTYLRFGADDAAYLAGARIATVERIARLAAERKVDAVLVAGDVFDAQTVPDRTVRRLFNALADFSGPWLMIPGNHDAALAASVWTRARRLECVPPNVQVLAQPESTLFEELGFVVLAAPLTQRQTHSDLTGWFDAAASPQDLVRIGLAHGCVTGILPESIDSANPLAADRATTARLDYLALGDWHGTRQVDERTWYSGTPEQDRFKGNDPGNVLLVEIAHPGAKALVETIPVGTYRWHEWEYEIAVASDVDQIEQRLAAVGGNDVVALLLRGEVGLEEERRIRTIVAVAQGRVRALETDTGGLRLRPTDEDIAALAADGYLGEVLNEMRHASAENPVAAEALGILAGFLADRRT